MVNKTMQNTLNLTHFFFILRCLGGYAVIFQRKTSFCDFLLPSLDEVTLPKKSLFLKERIAPTGANIFVLDFSSTVKEGKDENSRAASFERVPVHH